ncbi:hypothetical protein A2631_04005 [Candidatus Daviesbacteria bacterium RIFCSPHIGHO2_01_FULL_44_29]|uniref:Aspartate--tRNA(Asp/Asn) ligase n=1 Tax=Candidatus Daviesbacteria bacterium RIFCSPHIGHO2_02_FULL_43_12 TaxID=1797776 RepID=A0A1F5KG20_9BACT|nr:MAG: hypothetical protein A2631_04005 [Candidatus Daviesbacteria bacterium RIFCSPHIGHO2_01_FULL_44_29]OGE39893.1 MAG: hypothetical protein A3D25_03735 [Candidatus Daviesbacteria bacterium RIFCSPHIGHO2_02_FULL_43_12]OGE40690.1 MAG: hypothetical protein A3E86_04285 [Candidatus Daviesbacteria bacterium RIFCSPHIGHO2_12_FULL_47_45]OGE70426.1 MAG: hypothetical protein A3B55_01835 [Candidatus Daviesbacteria bacterium RIFCSPLOWO2_01_FULL_43_15]
MERTLALDCLQKVGQQATLLGWVQTIRSHGKIGFIDLRDRSGFIQIFVTGEMLQGITPESVVKITGQINKRPEKLINPNIPTGEIELSAQKVELVSPSQTSPFPLEGEGYDIGEETRLEYRYLDLRRNRLTSNIRQRHKIISFLRNWLTDDEFIEIETPILTKATPEGARDFLVPSRMHSGNFYALPQSPQQYKQLLMVAGFERYFQIARCFRDEDTRKDRQLEFTQLDMELSFVEQEDVMALNEKLLISLVEKLCPEKKIQEIPFPRISYKEAMQKYGTDRPDIRTDKKDPNLLAFCWVTDFPFFEKADSGGWTFTHNPFSAAKPEHQEWLERGENIDQILTTQYDVVLNGFEIGGGSIRNHKAEDLEKVFEIMGFSKEDISKNFGHMLKAFSFGTPPHGGIAWGLDRLVAILCHETTIREVIAFPASSTGVTAVMNAPTPAEPEQLDELGLTLKPKKSS